MIKLISIMRTLSDIRYFDGVNVLVRVDFNVPITNGLVSDDRRILAVLPTVDFLRKRGATVILVSHLESADGGKHSLRPVADHLDKLRRPVVFMDEMRGVHERIEAIKQSSSGSDQADKAPPIFLLENLRFFDGEMTNDVGFARELASLADIYVNDAFSVSHREHASIVGVPAIIPAYVGLQMEKEIAHLTRAFDPVHPFLFILGGEKFETKLPLVERFLGVADNIFIGGALANDALKAKGYDVGSSKVSGSDLGISSIVNRSKISLPLDVVVQDHVEKGLDAVSAGDIILDAGPKTCAFLKEKTAEARFVVWNGPLGLYEDGYKEATLEVAKMVAAATVRGAVTLVGGGDTLAAISALGIDDSFTFVSTGGAAMLDFLAKGTLPGIRALEASE